MKRLSLVGLICTIALMSPDCAWSSGPKLIRVNYRTPAAAYGGGDCGGHFGRSSRSFAGYSKVYMIETGIPNCPPYSGNGFTAESCQGFQLLARLSRRIHHEPSHCITQCFAGGSVCTCCDHNLTEVQPGIWRDIAAAMIKLKLKPAWEPNRAWQ